MVQTRRTDHSPVLKGRLGGVTIHIKMIENISDGMRMENEVMSPSLMVPIVTYANKDSNAAFRWTESRGH